MSTKMMAQWPKQEFKPRIRIGKVPVGSVVRLGSSSPDEAMTQQGFYFVVNDDKRPTDTSLLMQVGGENALAYTPEVLVHQHEYTLVIHEYSDQREVKLGECQKGDVVRVSDVSIKEAKEKDDHWLVATDPFISTGKLVYLVNTNCKSVKRVHSDAMVFRAAPNLTVQPNTV